MTKNEIISLLEAEGLSPNKSFGQNFLTGTDIVERIADAAGVDINDDVLEIGPGLGELTSVILARGASLTAVEIDAGLCRYLRKRFESIDRFKLVHADFLKIDLPGRFNKIVANLPYYCASEIIFLCAEKYDPDLICVMIQKEMARRIASGPGDADYGAMTVMLSFMYHARTAFDVPPSSFYPAPDITSTVVVLERRERETISAEERELFARLVKGAFWGRRKTFVKACSSSPHIALDRAILLDALRALGINDAVRGEQLSFRQYIEIARAIIPQKGLA
jgi:16S rRNA (adenine1518-N6/adenine1519-N6)-dimethyltransferase